MINAYCNDDIVIVKRTPDQWGTMTERKVVARARFEFKTRMVRNLQGEMVVSSGRVSLPLPYFDITHNDRIQFEEKQYSILNIERVKNFSTQFMRLDLA